MTTCQATPEVFDATRIIALPVPTVRERARYYAQMATLRQARAAQNRGDEDAARDALALHESLASGNEGEWLEAIEEGYTQEQRGN